MNRLGGDYGDCTDNGEGVDVKLLYKSHYTLQVRTTPTSPLGGIFLLAPVLQALFPSSPLLQRHPLWHSVEVFLSTPGSQLVACETLGSGP